MMSSSEGGSPNPILASRISEGDNGSAIEADVMVPDSKNIPYRQNHVSTVVLADVPIVALLIDGKERLCLAQISNTLLKGYSYNEIHNRRVALGITCVQCTPVQLEILRRAGAMPVSSRRCGMITKREAERLVKSFLEDTTPPKLPEDFAFEVHHDCGWGCRGSFVPSRYNSSRAKCIKCSYCNMYFSPNKFIFHYHRTPDAKYNHPDAANFNSWRRHLRLVSEQENMDLVYAWEDVKAMFNGGSRKRMSSISTRPDNSSEKTSNEEVKKARFEDNPERKSLRTPPIDYSPYPIFSPHASNPPFPIISSSFPPMSLPMPGHQQERPPYVTPLRRTMPGVHLSNDFPSPQRPRPMGNIFCSPFDKIWPKYPSLFFSGNTDLHFPRCTTDRIIASESSDIRTIGFKSPKLSPSVSKHGDSESGSRMFSREPEGPLSGRTAEKGWCSAFRLVGNSGQQETTKRNIKQLPKSLKPCSPQSVSDSDVESPDIPIKEDTKQLTDETVVTCDENNTHRDSEIKEAEIDIEDSQSDSQSEVSNSPVSQHEDEFLHEERTVSPTDKSTVDTTKEPLPTENITLSNASHRKETADSTSGSTDYSNLSREQLQTELQQEMEARRKVEKECTTIKETFEDQIKKAMQYREDIAKQLQAVRETLCTKLDQERKVRLSLQERLKEAHDALHSFTCNVLTARHCNECTVKEIMPR